MKYDKEWFYRGRWFRDMIHTTRNNLLVDEAISEMRLSEFRRPSCVNRSKNALKLRSRHIRKLQLNDLREGVQI